VLCNAIPVLFLILRGRGAYEDAAFESGVATLFLASGGVGIRDIGDNGYSSGAEGVAEDILVACMADAPRHLCYSDVTVVLQWCYSGVTVVLQWSYSGVTVVLHWCCSGVTVVLQWCYSGVTVVLQWCAPGHL
jgi:hypothetical protein